MGYVPILWCCKSVTNSVAFLQLAFFLDLMRVSAIWFTITGDLPVVILQHLTVCVVLCQVCKAVLLKGLSDCKNKSGIGTGVALYYGHSVTH
jgi:hypothetical protein